MNLRFDYPWALWIFAVIVPFIVSDVYGILKRRRGMPPALGRRLAGQAVFFALSLVFFVIALSGPQWGKGGGNVARVSGGFRQGLDVVMAFDVSRSMDIRDVPDSGTGAVTRLERGLSVAIETVLALPDARYAAATGRNRALVTVPLTWDTNAALNFLEAVDGGILTGRGTNLESLLDAAAGAFQDSSPAAKIIVLVSDGETLSGSLKAALSKLSRNNIAVAALAVGSDSGSPVPELPDVNSRRDIHAMLTAAEITGGTFIDGNRDDASEVLAGYLRSIAPRAGNSGGAAENIPRWFFFLVAAIISFVLSKFCVMKK